LISRKRSENIWRGVSKSRQNSDLEIMSVFLTLHPKYRLPNDIPILQYPNKSFWQLCCLFHSPNFWPKSLPNHPAWWRISLSIPCNLDPDSNLT
jgi:hypothetical protein